ncbi:hypothetical protein [Schlesneria paludicola]|uniref:hypothetical protein n=1 Tax=Schlesneria paludicola TaxID=360056 RepID=UPI00029B0E30|nr:hypothetical protein [Schlesneria paludicola]
MSSSPLDPRWDKLPDSPEEFFELQLGYTQADLKRAYFRFIKQFKPEKHPQEFQQIRTAYEQLDSQLRYGTESVSLTSVLQKYTWIPPEQTPPAPAQAQDQGEGNAVQPARQRKRTPQTPALPLHERLANESPEALYEELQRQQDKQPFHYYALAVLSDDTQDKDSQEFVRWILIGLKLFPRDPALYQMLYAAIRGPIRSEDIPKLLSTISIVMPDDRFYSLTEALWDRVIRDEPFETFRKLLTKCESNLSDYRLGHKLAFYAHFLKAAMWSDDHKWVSNAFSLLDKHHNELPPGIEYEIEVLYRVREYLQLREQFVEVHPIRKLIDHTIRIYCTKSPLEARNAFLACQIHLATSATDVLEAFPPNEQSPAVDVFIPLWQFLNAEISEQTFEEDPRTAGKASVRQMLLELESKTSRTLLGEQLRWSVTGAYLGRKVFYITFFAVLYFSLVCFFNKDSPARGWALAVSVLVTGAGGWMLDRRYSPLIWERWCLRLAWACYSEIWRPEFQQFLTRTYLPYRQLLTHLSNVEDSEDEYGYISLATALVRSDYGLMLLSDAQKVVV